MESAVRCNGNRSLFFSDLVLILSLSLLLGAVLFCVVLHCGAGQASEGDAVPGQEPVVAYETRETESLSRAHTLALALARYCVVVCGIVVQGKPVRVTQSQAKNRLFVGNVPKIWNQAELQEALEPAGKGITTVDLLMVKGTHPSCSNSPSTATPLLHYTPGTVHLCYLAGLMHHRRSAHGKAYTPLLQ